jgi:parallel beta-helix repeat protein
VKPTAFVLAILLLFFIVFVSLPQIRVVNAEGTIYIRADGSIEGTDKILRDGNVYSFTGNIYDSIVVERDNVVLNGGGYLLQGLGTGRGIELSDRKNVTVKNFEIKRFEIGIYIYDYSEPRNNTISANIITNNTFGIYIEHAHNNTIFGNTITNNEHGIYLLESRFNVLRNNSLSNNRYSFAVEFTDFVNNVDTSNLVDGKPMIYWVNQQHITVPSEAGYVALINCKNITISNLTLDSNGQGILLASTTDSTIANNTVTKNENGIWLYDSPNNTVAENIVTNNAWGIRLQGIYPTYAPNNRIYGNTITNNKEYGIIIIDSVDNSIYGNNITNNECGIHISSFMETTNNTIHHNNFINNTEQASVPGYWHMIVFEEHWVPPASNFWDDGKEGNYWSNYVTRYPNATEKDGFIWSTPYNISENNQDNHPLTAPIYLFDAGTWEWTQYIVYVVSNSTPSDFSFNPEEGALLRFNVEGEAGTTGFCRVSIPKGLLSAEGDWTVLVDRASVTPTIDEDATNTYLYFTYNHSTKTVEIIGTDVIPEFPSWIILPLLITTTFAAIFYKKRLTKTQATNRTHSY